MYSCGSPRYNDYTETDETPDRYPVYDMIDTYGLMPNADAVQPPTSRHQPNLLCGIGDVDMNEPTKRLYGGPHEGGKSPQQVGSKLRYKRASTACKQCRKAKIRCVASCDDPRGRCRNCVRMKKECSSYLTGQASADDTGEKRVERYSPDPERSPQAHTLAQDSPCMGTGAVDTDFTGIDSFQSGTGDALSSYGFTTTSDIDWHCSWLRSPCVSPMSFNRGGQNFLNLHVTSENSGLMANSEDFSSGQGIQLPGMASPAQFSAIPLMASTASPHTLSPANVEISPGHSSYPVPMQALTGLSESARTCNMLRDNDEAHGPPAGIEGYR